MNADLLRRFRELNHARCWESRDSRARLWPMVNRHLWRIRAMYFGGDCRAAGFPGAEPYQRLYPYGRAIYGGGTAEDLAEQRAWGRKYRRSYARCIPAYRQPRAGTDFLGGETAVPLRWVPETIS